MRISVVGLGKIGCCIMVTLASKGFKVIGVDINKEIVEKINKGIAPYYEPGLQKLLKDNLENFCATTKHSEIAGTDMTIIMVQTPSLPDGSFSTEYVEKAVLEVGRCIPDSKKYHNVIITSTILPGVMDEKIKPLLERSSNRKVGKNVGLCYVPEFIAMGNIINGLLYPDFVVIGESDEKAGQMVHNVYNAPEPNGFEISDYSIHRMSLYNAELAKIALNVYITMKISFANTIAEICENMPTGNAEHVLNAIGSDTRIGKKFLKPGLSYGGTCFPRDDKAFVHVAEKYKAQGLLPRTAELINVQQVERMVTMILQKLSEVGTNKLSVLGLTYKPDTNLTIESASLKIIQKLLKEGIKISVYDPSPMLEDLPMVSGLVFSQSVEQCLSDAEVVFIATPWNEFKKISKEKFQTLMKPVPTIIDAWGVQKQLKNDPSFNYKQIGMYMGN